MEDSLCVFTEKYSERVRQIITSIGVINPSTGMTIPAKALWDTGATSTCLSKEIVSRLDLQSFGYQKISTPSGSGIVGQYRINIMLNNELQIQQITVLDSEIGQQGIDVLIGMDIISLGDFAISNFENKTNFSFRIPSKEHVDYKPE